MWLKKKKPYDLAILGDIAMDYSPHDKAFDALQNISQ